MEHLGTVCTTETSARARHQQGMRSENQRSPHRGPAKGLLSTGARMESPAAAPPGSEREFFFVGRVLFFVWSSRSHRYAPLSLLRCGPAEPSLSRRSQAWCSPMCSPTTAAQRRDSGPPSGSRSRTPSDPLRRPCRKWFANRASLTTSPLETRPVADRHSWCGSTEPAAGV
jgi:hypothetical protein